MISHYQIRPLAAELEIDKKKKKILSFLSIKDIDNMIVTAVSSTEPLLACDGPDQPPTEGVVLSPGAGIPGPPAVRLHLLLLPLPPPLLAGSLLSLPLRVVPGPAQSLTNLLPPQTRLHAVVCSPAGIQWRPPPA